MPPWKMTAESVTLFLSNDIEKDLPVTIMEVSVFKVNSDVFESSIRKSADPSFQCKKQSYFLSDRLIDISESLLAVNL